MIIVRKSFYNNYYYRILGTSLVVLHSVASGLVSLLFFTDNAGEEQRQEFLGEIELMKQIGKHQNVLSFVGCWTTTKPLLLVIEYVAHGDLRQWLIRKRRQVTLINSNGETGN